MMSSFHKKHTGGRIADASVNDLCEAHEIRRKPEFRSGSTRRGGAACADGAGSGVRQACGDLKRGEKVAPSVLGERVQGAGVTDGAVGGEETWITLSAHCPPTPIGSDQVKPGIPRLKAPISLPQHCVTAKPPPAHAFAIVRDIPRSFA